MGVTPRSWSWDVKNFDTIPKKYILFTSFLWTFTWYFLKLESYGAHGPSPPTRFWQTKSAIPPPKCSRDDLASSSQKIAKKWSSEGVVGSNPSRGSFHFHFFSSNFHLLLLPFFLFFPFSLHCTVNTVVEFSAKIFRNISLLISAYMQNKCSPMFWAFLNGLQP